MKYTAAVLGATGMVGQRFITLLQKHPWFQLTAVTGSERRAGQKYGDAAQWKMSRPLRDDIANLPLLPPDAEMDAQIIFSALPADEAKILEPLYARRGHAVFSNASAFRMEEDIPLIIPEVNPEHLDMIPRQQKNRGWSGFIVTNPNCSTIQIVLALKPLHSAARITKMAAVTMQAVSGAGYPGVSSYDIMGNIIPYIGQEEEKIERETKKLLGIWRDDHLEDAQMIISAQCTRAPVLEGHTALISVATEQPLSPQNAIAIWRRSVGLPQELQLPSAPNPLIHVFSENDRPQPARDAELGEGMAVSVGRVRVCPIFGLKFVNLGHNTIRGATGASLLNAELAAAKQMIH